MISAPPQSVAWFARHELLLAWRDWLSMMTAGKRTRERVMLVFVALFVVLLVRPQGLFGEKPELA